MFDNVYRGDVKSSFIPVITFFKSYTKAEARIFTHMHYHDYFELLYIKHGRVRMLVSSAEFEAHDGSLVVINPYETHYGEMLSDELEYYCIVFDLTSLHLENEADILSNKLMYQNHIPQAYHLEGLVAAVNDSYTNTKQGWELRAKGSVLLILSELSEYLHRTSVSSKYIFEKKVIDYVTLNYASPITSGDVSNALGYNQNYFCRAFKSSFSQRFCDYLNSYRIHRAKELLKTNSISEVSSMTGFSGINYFSSVFKKTTGLSPSEYKKSLS